MVGLFHYRPIATECDVLHHKSCKSLPRCRCTHFAQSTSVRQQLPLSDYSLQNCYVNIECWLLTGRLLQLNPTSLHALNLLYTFLAVVTTCVSDVYSSAHFSVRLVCRLTPRSFRYNIGSMLMKFYCQFVSLLQALQHHLCLQIVFHFHCSQTISLFNLTMTVC